ncbi:MAG: hypothetical protein OQK71_11845, partial [Desulfobacter sp.]|nr:hypothetical protein [Desulfobacter sp.]
KCHGFNLNLNFTNKNIKSFQIFNIMAYAIYSMISRQSAIAGQRYGFYLLGSSLDRHWANLFKRNLIYF